jgi:hypothetical protein
MAARREVLSHLLRSVDTSGYSSRCNLISGTQCISSTTIHPTSPHRSCCVRHIWGGPQRGASSRLLGKPTRKTFEFSDAQKQHRVKETKEVEKQYDRPFKHVVVPGRISPVRPVPDHIKKPEYATIAGGRVKAVAVEGPFEIKGAKSIEAMRASCALARKILDFAGTLVKVSIHYYNACCSY